MKLICTAAGLSVSRAGLKYAADAPPGTVRACSPPMPCVSPVSSKRGEASALLTHSVSAAASTGDVILMLILSLISGLRGRGQSMADSVRWTPAVGRLECDLIERISGVEPAGAVQ